MNTNMKSWWYKSSIGCHEHIETRLEQYKYERSFEKIKNKFTETTPSTSTIIGLNLRSAAPDNIHQSNRTLLTTTRKMSKNVVLENFIRTNCFLPFYTIEIVHSGVLILLGVSVF